MDIYMRLAPDELGIWKRNEATPDSALKVDSYGNLSTIKTIRTPSGESIDLKLEFTGKLAKELKKMKFKINSDTSFTLKPAPLKIDSIFDVINLYKKSLPISERIYMWLRSRRYKNKLINRYVTRVEQNAYKENCVERYKQEEIHNHYKELGGCVIMSMDKDNNPIEIPLKKIDHGHYAEYVLPDGMSFENTPDGIEVPGLNVKAKKPDVYPWEKTPIKEPAQEIKPDPIEDVKEPTEAEKDTNDVAAVISNLSTVASMLQEAKPLNDTIRSTISDTGRSVEIEKDCMGSVIISDSSNKSVNTKSDTLPENWEYPNESITVKSNMTVQQEHINHVVEILEFPATEIVVEQTDALSGEVKIGDKIYDRVGDQYVEKN